MDTRPNPVDLPFLALHLAAPPAPQANAGEHDSWVWQQALRRMGDGVWDWNVRANQLLLSPECKAMFGFEPHELADDLQAFDELTASEDLLRMRSERQAHLDGLTPAFVSEHRIRCKDGEWKLVLSRGVIVERDEQGRPLRMMGTHTDLSPLRQVAVLRQERDRAAAQDLAKSQFLSRVSHELRTPLNAILGFSKLLDLDATLTQRQRGWVHNVLQSGEHLLALVEDVLDLSSVQTGQLSFELESVGLWPVVEEVCTMLASYAAERQISLSFDHWLNEDILLLVDRKRLKQILTNLLTNAIKFNRVQGWVRIEALVHGQAVEINVSDSGAGIAADKIERLFNPFERAGAQQRGIAGTGLGLALSRQLTEAMGGAIGVTSVEGQGARFSVRLPLALPAAPAPLNSVQT